MPESGFDEILRIIDVGLPVRHLCSTVSGAFQLASRADTIRTNTVLKTGPPSRAVWRTIRPFEAGTISIAATTFRGAKGEVTNPGKQFAVPAGAETILMAYSKMKRGVKA